MTTLTLYQAADELAPLLDQIDEDGVISDELHQALSMFESKGVSVAAYILNCEVHAEVIEAAAAKMAARAEPFKNRAKSLRRYLTDQMKRTGISEIKCPEFAAKLYIERDASVEIVNAAQIPAEYMTQPKPVEPAPNKAAIKAALAKNIDVPGARIIKKDRLELK